MLKKIILLFLVTWSTLSADNPYNGFETICIPQKACYFVSKFKTSWQTAKEMCLSKTHENILKFNDTDKNILNPLISTMETKRYWVVEPKESSNQKSHQITIILNRKRRSFVIEQPESETIITTVEQVKNWNWEQLIENTKDTDRSTIKRNIKKIFEAVKTSGNKNLDPNLLKKWKSIYEILSKSRIHQQFIRTQDQWTELTDEFGNGQLESFISTLDPKLQVEWKDKLSKVKWFVKNKEFNKLDLNSLNEWKNLIYKLRLKIHGKESYKKRLLVQWQSHVEWLKKWKWMELLKFVSGNYKERVTKTVNELFVIIKRQEFEKINLELVKNVKFVMRLLKRLWRIHIKYGSRKKANMIRRLKLILSIDWRRIINELEGIDRNQWIERFNKLKNLIQLKRYNKIDVNWLAEFKPIIDKFRGKIKINYIHQKRQIKKIRLYLRLLKRWNWKNLVVDLNEKEKENIAKEIELMERIIKEEHFNEINVDLIKRFKVIFKILRKIKQSKYPKGNIKVTKEILLKKIKLIIDSNWLNIINGLEGVDKVKWTTRFNKLIQMIRNNNIDKIDFKWLLKFKRILKLIHRKSHPRKQKLNLIKKFVNRLKKWNWPDLIKNIDEKDRENVKKEIELVLKLVKENKFKEIDENLYKRIRVIFKTIRKIKNDKRPTIDIKVQKERLLNKLKLIIDTNWQKVINETKGIDKVKWTNRINKLIQLIKLNQPDKIDLKWLQKFKRIINIVKKNTIKKPITAKIITKNVKRFIKRLIKWNWPDLIKNIDEKDRENVKKEIELVLKLVKEKKFKEIDENLYKRIRVIFKTIRKIKNDKRPTIDIKVQKERLLNKLKLIIDTNWQKVINETKGIDKVKWTNRINKLIQLIKLNQPDKIDLKWLQKFKRIINIVKKNTIKKPITAKIITKNVKRFIKRLIKWNWPDLIKNIDEKDRENVKKEIELVLKLVKEKKFKEIDENLYKRIRVIFKTIRKIKNDKRPTIDIKVQKERLLNKLKLIIDTNWQKVINETKGIDKVKWTNRINKLIQLIKLNQPDKIDLKWLQKFKRIINIVKKNTIKKPITAKIITKNVKRFIKRLIKWNWPDLIKNIDEKDRENVKKEIELVLKLVKEKKFKEIDENLYKRIRVIFKTIRKIKNDKRPTIDIKVQKERLLNKLKLIIDTNWQKVINETKGIDKVKWTNRINKLIQLIKLNQPDKIDLKWLQKFKRIINIVKKNTIKKPITAKIITKNVKRFIKRLIKWNWPDLIKNIDEKDRENVKKEIELVLKLVKEKKFKEIDENLYKRIRVIFKTIRKIKNDKRPTIDIKVQKERLLNKLKLIIDTNWQKVINETKGIDKVKWTNRINKLIQLIKLNQPDKIDLKWLQKFKRIINIVKKNTIKKPITAKIITKNVKRFIKRLIKWNWPDLIKNIDEKDRENVKKEIELVLKLVKENKFKEIDENLYKRIRVIFKKVRKVKIDKIPTEKKQLLKEKILTKLKPILNENWTKIIEKSTNIDKTKWTTRIKTITELINSKQTGKIDYSWLLELLEIFNFPDEPDREIPTIDLAVVTEKSISLITDLNQLNWEELVKYIGEPNQPEVVNKIKTFIFNVKNKKFQNIDGETINFITEIIFTFKKIKENRIKTENTKNIKSITDKSLKFIDSLHELKWEELTKYIDEKNRQTVIDKIKTFIRFVENKEFENIDIDLLNWILEIIKTLRKARKSHVTNEKTKTNNLKTITETSIKYINSLHELKWEELTKYIDEKNRQTVIDKIKTFIRFVENKEFENIDIDLLNWILEIIKTLRKAREINETNEKVKIKNLKTLTETSLKYFNYLIELKWEELVQHIDSSSRVEVINKIKTFISFVQNKSFDKIDVNLANWIAEIINILRKIRIGQSKVTENKTLKITENIQLTLPSNWQELLQRINGIDYQLWTSRIDQLLTIMKSKNHQKIDFEWIGELEKIVNLISQESIKMKKEVFLNETSIEKLKGFVSQLKEWNWNSLLIYIDENNRQQIQNEIQGLISVVESGNFEKLEIQTVNWFYQIFETFSKIKEFMNNGYVYDSKIKTWVKHITQNQNIVRKRRCILLNLLHGAAKKLIPHISIGLNIGGKPRRPRPNYNQVSIQTIRTNINSLKLWNWENFLQYIDEDKREPIQTNINKIIYVIENGESDKLDPDTIDWFIQIFEEFKKINYAIENGYVYDPNTRTWTKNTVEVENKIRKKRCLFNIFKGFHRLLPRISIRGRIGHVNREDKLNFIIDMSHKYLVILNELRWNELIDSIDGFNKRSIFVKINKFIHYVNTRKYHKINRKFLNWLSQIIITLQNTKIRLTGSMKQKRIEIAKKVLVNLPSNWKEVIVKLPNINVDLWIKRIQLLLPMIELNEFDKIDFEWIDELQKLVDLITEESIKTVEKPKVNEVTIKAVKENVNSLKQWNWETYLKYIDEDKREEVQRNVNNVITIIENVEYDKLDVKSVDWFNQIFEVFNKMYYATTNGYVYDEKTKSWVKTVVEVENNTRKRRCILLNLLHGAAKKLIPHISIGLNIGGKPRRPRPNYNQVSIQTIRTNINSLKLWNWENFLQYIDEDKREPIQTNINKIIYVIENGESDKLDPDTIDWFIQIFEEFKKINYAIENGYVYDPNTRTWTKNTVEVENKIRKKRCFSKGHRKIRKFRPHNNLKFHNKIHINNLFHWKKIHQKHHRKIVSKERKRIVHKVIKRVNWLEKWNWKNLMKYVVDNHKRDTLVKIKYIISLIKNKDYDNIDEELLKWISTIKTKLKIVRKIKKETKNIDENLKIVMKKSHKFVDILNQLRWIDIIDEIEGDNKPEIKEKIKRFITLVQNREYDKIDTEFLNWLFEIIENIKKTKQKLTETDNTKNVKVIEKIQINLPSNWKELLQNVEGIDVNLWTARIENLLSLVQSKEYQKIDFEWIDELQKIVQLISTQVTESKEKFVLPESTKTKIKENINSLKQWNWESLLKYIEETNRKQVETDVKKMIVIVENEEFDKIDSQFVQWFNQIVELFNKINYAITNGYVYNSETKTWVKNVVEETLTRKRRSLNQNKFSDLNLSTDLITKVIEQVQRALSYNLMILRGNNLNSNGAESNDRPSDRCPFINKVNENLVTKFTNCDIKQKFICKMSMN